MAVSPLKRKAGMSPTASSHVWSLSDRTPSYGCDHIQGLWTANTQNVEIVKKQYRAIVKSLSDAPSYVTQTSRSADANQGGTHLLSTYLCLQCSAICSKTERDQHAKKKSHSFSIDSKSGCIWCSNCQDFIYDPRLEEDRLTIFGGVFSDSYKRIKIDQKPAKDDKKLIDTFTTNATCNAVGLKGLQNLGQTCFMNVILQSLLHNPLLRNWFLSDGHRSGEFGSCSKDHCLACGVDDLFSELFTNEKLEPYAPVDFLQRFWLNENMQLAGYQQQDAHEFMQFLLNQLHSADKESGPDSSNCNCIIHKTFSGKLQSDVACANCKYIAKKMDPVMDLNLDMRATAKPGAKASSMTLAGCLEEFSSPEVLTSKEYKCPQCQQRGHKTTKQLTLKKLPPVLCITLKKFASSSAKSSKIEQRATFPLKVDMFPYTTNGKHGKGSKAAKDKSRCIYSLCTVIVHFGDMNNGHYICYIKEGRDWFCFDDSKVIWVPESQVLAADAYLLFYVQQ